MGFERIAKRMGNERGASLVEVLVSLSSLLIITIAAVFSSLAYGVNGVESSRESSTRCSWPSSAWSRCGRSR